MSDAPGGDERFGPPVERSVAPGPDPTGVRVELGVRSLSPDAQPLLDRAVEGLDRAVADGAVDGYDLVVTGERFDPTAAAATTPAGHDLAELLADVREWAALNGASVDPFFRTERVDSWLADERYSCVRWPTVFLAEYHGEELAFVAPSETGGTRVDVLDRIRTLAAAETPRPEPPLVE